MEYKATRDIHPTVTLGDVVMDHNISIGEGTYINSGQLFAGQHSRVIIGRFCAIGYNVHIKARSHNPLKPVPANLTDSHRRIEADIVIGDHVWIGDNVFIGPGITVSHHAIIGANAVVTHDIPPYVVVGGVPARVIRTRNQPKEQNASK